MSIVFLLICYRGYMFMKGEDIYIYLVRDCEVYVFGEI